MLPFPPAACGKAPLAQLDRASDYESEGREFESLRVHFLSPPVWLCGRDVEVMNTLTHLNCVSYGFFGRISRVSLSIQITRIAMSAGVMPGMREA